MVIKKYCSKQFILRLCMLIALLGSAALFDMYHATNQKSTNPHAKLPVQNQGDGLKMYVCNQINTYNLKTPSNEFSIRFKLAYTQDKFLLKHYNLRTFQMMKAESLHTSFPVLCSFHSLAFNRVIYFSPDDTPPLS
ncbi:MAG: hypothetical protein ACM3P1_04340 [Candidatus Saccharibacteria bacterium]